MRITGGVLGGRVVKVPPKGVRPTQERVREAVFSMLGDAIVDAHVWDLFAGSGALGMEAWSRGAGQVRWVEADARTHHQLKKNVAALCGEQVAQACICADVFAFLKRVSHREQVDFILADPPYDRHTATVQSGALLLQALSAAGLPQRGACVLLEQHAAQPVCEHPDWLIRKDKKYGDTRVLLYVPSADCVVAEGGLS